MIYFVTRQTSLFESYPANIVSCSIQDAITEISKSDILAIDTETEGFDPFTCDLIYLQIGTETKQYVIDCSTVSVGEFKDVLEAKELIMHNAKFDLRFLYVHGVVPTKVFDTFIAETVLTTGMDKPAGYRGLDGCLRRYLKVQLQKEIRGLIHKERFSVRVLQYSADDVKYLHKLRESQIEALRRQDLLTCCKLENKFVCVLAYIEFCGIYLDKEAWLLKVKEDEKNKLDAEEELNNWVLTNLPTSKFVDNQLSLFETGVKCNINWASDTQVLKLFKQLGINVKDTKTGKESVDMRLLVSQESKFEILPIYIKYSKLNKLVSSFGRNILKTINRETGRIHTSFRQIKDTGRMSCGNRDTNSPNLQQIPSDERHRHCFKAEKNNSIIVCDYASQESRILADISKDPTLLKFYLEGGADLHSYAAKVVYKELAEVTLDDIKKYHKDKRQIMKGFNFALAYGGTGETVSRNLNIPIDIAKKAEQDYFKVFNRLKKYFEIAKAKPLKDGYVLIDKVSGRKSFIDFFEEFKRLEKELKVPGFWDEYRKHKEQQSFKFMNFYKPKVSEYFKMKGIIERKGLNYVVQGTAASQTKLAGIKLFNWILSNNYFNVVKIINLVHDEIVVECPTEISEEVKLIVQKSMEDGANKFMELIPMEATPEISQFWIK